MNFAKGNFINKMSESPLFNPFQGKIKPPINKILFIDDGSLFGGGEGVVKNATPLRGGRMV